MRKKIFQRDVLSPTKKKAFRQKKDRALQNKFRAQPKLHVEKPHAFSDSTCELIAKNDEVYIPKSLQHKCAEWHHLTLMHPGEQRLELTIAQHCTCICLKPACVRVCKKCENCAASKERDQKTSLLPPKPTPEIIPWHTLCIDLVGPCKCGDKKKPETHIELHCVTMVDPATGFFQTVEIGQKTADATANGLEIHWLTRCPWPTEMTVDKGREFAREVSETLQNEHGVKRKIVASRNPQSNSMIERCHKTLHNMIRSAQIKDKRDIDSLLGFKGVLAACRKAMNSTAHTTARAMPTQLVFGRDAMLNATLEADWQFIRKRKQRLIIQNNKRENAKGKPRACNAGDVVVVKAGKGRKHGSNPHLDHMRITQACDNGTVKLAKVADNNGGAVSQT